MKNKLIVTMGAVGLAAWMGTSFIAPAEVEDVASMAEGADVDSHRTGALAPEEVCLPSKAEVGGELNLFYLLTRED